MKVAVLMSGNMYNYKHSYNTIIDNLLKPYDCDLFIYTTYKNKIRDYPENLDITQEERRKIEEMFSPYLKQIVFSEEDPTYSDELKIESERYLKCIENFTYETPECYYYGPAHVRQIDQYFRVLKCLKMSKKYGKYDVVIRCRPDDYIKKPIILKNVTDRTIFCLGPGSIDKLYEGNFVSEHFFYGTEESIEYFLENFIRNYGTFRERVILYDRIDATLSPESQFTQFCKNYNLNMVHNNYDIGYETKPTQSYPNITDMISFYTIK